MNYDNRLCQTDIFIKIVLLTSAPKGFFLVRCVEPSKYTCSKQNVQNQVQMCMFKCYSPLLNNNFLIDLNPVPKTDSVAGCGAGVSLTSLTLGALTLFKLDAVDDRSLRGRPRPRFSAATHKFLVGSYGS